MGIAMMVISLAITAYGAYQQNEAGIEAKKIADENARKEEEVAAEEAARREDQLDADMSESRARIFASGMTEEGSAGMYLGDLLERGQDEIAWIEKSGKLRADVLRAEGRMARSQARIGAFQTLATGFASSGSFLSSSPTTVNNTSTYTSTSSVST